MATIAVVEKEALVALDIAKTLAYAGHSILGPFYHLKDFLDEPALGRCELAIIDMDTVQSSARGVESAQRIWLQNAVPIVLITALSDEATLTEAKGANPFGILVKPFSEQELKSTIDIALYRSNMEGKLASSERRYRELFDFSMTARCITDGEGTVEVTNKAFRDLFGLSDGMALTLRLSDAQSWPLVCSLLSKAGQIESRELSMTDGSGSPLDILGSFSLISFPETKNQRISAEFFNETESKRLREELHQAQKMEALGRLAGGVAHDFNNILTAIVGHSEMLKMDISPKSPLREDVDGILQATDRARQLTQQLLSFSRKQPFSPRKIDAGQLARDSSKLLRKLTGEGVFFSVFVAEDSLPVFADPIQIEQALINLVANARDALENRPDPRITLILEKRNLPQPSLFRGVLLPGGDYVTIEVADNGIGMSPEVAEEAFEPYFTTKAMGKGTGLGLAIVSSVAVALSGAVDLHTEQGKGTSIVLWIPLLSEEESQKAEKMEEAGALSNQTEAAELHFVNSPRILVVDDDESLLGFLATMLGKAGAEVSSALNGGEALLKTESVPFDICVIDINLPGINGISLYERLSIQHKQRCVFITGRLDVEVQVPQGIPLLQKPFTPQALINAIKGQLASVI